MNKQPTAFYQIAIIVVSSIATAMLICIANSTRSMFNTIQNLPAWQASIDHANEAFTKELRSHNNRIIVLETKTGTVPSQYGAVVNKENNTQ
jgi:hypothetical protein